MAELTAAGGEVCDDRQRGARIKGGLIPVARVTGRVRARERQISATRMNRYLKLITMLTLSSCNHVVEQTLRVNKL